MPSSTKLLRPIFKSGLAKLLLPGRLIGGGTAFGPCVANGGGGPIPCDGLGSGFIIFDIKPENPGEVCAIEFTAAFWKDLIRSGFCLKISSIPGIALLNIVFVICTIIALPPS